MRALYLILTCLIILLGVIHVSATFALFDGLSSPAIWFASGGLAIILTGLINLLNRAYGAAAPGVRCTAIGSNLAMTIFAALAGVAGAASGIQLAIIVGLMAATTLLSFRPSRSAVA